MNIALILSGGRGLRLGSDIPKQYLEAGGRPVISWCLETLSLHERIDAIRIVAEPVWQEFILRCAEGAEGKGECREDENSYGGNPCGAPGEEFRERFREKFCGFSLPGENRQLSILHGLEDIRRYGADTDYVLVHDAARPFLSARLVTECLAAAKGHDGVLPVLPMKDTVYASEDGRTVSALLKREDIFAGQAPELFQLGKYYEANQRLLPKAILKINGSTEPAIMAGMDIVMIPGDEGNFKVTTKKDLERFREIVEKNRERKIKMRPKEQKQKGDA